MTELTMYYLGGVLVMALVTYLPRMLPFAVFHRPVKSRFVRSFLYYMPFAVLSAMVIPSIFYSTATPWSAAVGMVIALVFSYVGFSLLPVALLSSAGVLFMEFLLIGWQW